MTSISTITAKVSREQVHGEAAVAYDQTAILTNGATLPCGARLVRSLAHAEGIERDGERVCAHWWANKDGQAAIEKAMQ